MKMRFSAASRLNGSLEAEFANGGFAHFGVRLVHVLPLMHLCLIQVLCDSAGSLDSVLWKSGCLRCLSCLVVVHVMLIEIQECEVLRIMLLLCIHDPRPGKPSHCSK